MADNNNKPRLQLRSHKDLFATREDVINYLDREVKFDSNGLFGEPVLLFYGDIDKPNMILAVGSTIEGGSNSYYVIDNTELKKMIEQASEDAVAGADASKLLDKVIAVVGLDKLTENRIDPDVEYNPEHEIVRDCETVKDAIETLAEAVAMAEYTADNEGNNVEITIDNTNKKISAKARVLEVNTRNINGGTVAPITVAVDEDGDGKGVNITATLNYGEGLSVVNGQLTAGVPKVVKSASYNPNTNELVIVFDNGTQEGEAVVIPVSGLIDEFKANNDGHTVTVIVNTAGEDGFTEFSADVNLLNSPNNLIERSDGAIFVHKDNIQSIASDVATGIADAKMQALSDVVDGKLEEKADVAELDAAYAYLNEHKAEKQDVERVLGTKAGLSDIEGVLDGVSYEGTTLRFTMKNVGGTADVDLSNLIDDYNLKPATSDKLGGVIVENGSGLVVDEEGKLEVDDTFINTEIESAISELAGGGLKFDENNRLAVNIDSHEKYISTELDGTLHTEGIDEAIDAATDGFVDGVTYDANTHVISVTKKNAEGNTIDLSELVNDACIKQSDVVQSFSDSSLPASNPVSKSAVLDYVENIQEGLNIDAINSEIADLQSGKVDKSVYEAYVASNDAAVASKADSASVDAALNGKVDKSVYDAYVASNNASVALKADKAAVDAALGNKADSADVIDNATLDNNVLYLKRGNTEITNVDLSTLSDVYSAGDGLNLANNTFSVRLRTGDKYIELEDGELKSKGIDEALALKANAADVTAALNDKANAAETASALAVKADKSYVDTELERKADEADVTEALDAKADAADVNAALSGKQDSLTTSNTVSIVTEGGVTKPNVRISGTQGNIINSLTDGLYVNVSVDVDQSTNKLVFTVNGSTNSIDLPGVKVVQSSAYNDVTKTLDIIFADGNSTSIPVAELVDRVSVPSLQEGPVVLTLTNVNGGQEMSASLDARKLTADSSVIESNALLYDEPTNSLYVENLKPSVEQNTSTISDHEGRIAQLESAIGQLTDLVNQLETKVNSYGATISEYESRIEALETQVYDRMLDLNDVNGDGEYTPEDGLDGF